MNRLFFLFTCFIPGLMIAQVSEGGKPMTQGTNNALTVTLNGISVSDAEKIWKNYIGPFDGKSKYNKKANELFVDNASIASVSPNTIDLYSKAEKVGNDVNFSVWFDLGGAYLSSIAHPDRYPAAVEVMKGYLREISRFKTNEQLKEEEKKLDKLNSSLKDLTRDKEGYEKDIKKAEDKITESKSKIDQNIKDQAAKQAEIDAQRSVIDKVKSDLDKI